jgi:hypothetical protein
MQFLTQAGLGKCSQSEPDFSFQIQADEMKHIAQFLHNDPIQVPPNAESIPSQELLNHNFPEIMGEILINSHPTP